MNQYEANLAAAVMMIDRTIQKRTIDKIIKVIDDFIDHRRGCCENPDSAPCETCTALLNVASLVYLMGEVADPNDPPR